MVTPDLVTAYPIVHLEALEILVSDHAPLMLSCKGLHQRKKRFQFESFWFKYQQPKLMVQNLWPNIPANQADGVAGFHSKVAILHRALCTWHSQSFGTMEKQLQSCKKLILFFYQIEENRPLFPNEFGLRQRIKERAFELSNNIESKWKQRSRCNWIVEGDRNTRFFHAFASGRLRRNLVSQIEYEGQIVIDENLIREIFTTSMRSTLGTNSVVLNFHPEVLYPQNPCLLNLQVIFTCEEIDVAVRQLANNKASGPDGLPNEFIKVYWNEIKSDIYQLLDEFYENRLKLEEFNEANIIMIPKVDQPANTSDFRPISVLDLIPKLISKIISNRLRLLLPILISPNQTAFVHGRQISENFATTRELLHHINHIGKPAVFAKIDFKKAFDSVEWAYLIRVMKARGFPNRWLTWISNI